MGLQKLKTKLSKRQIQKTYANIITLAQQLGKSEWETPLEVNNGKIHIKIILNDKPFTEVTKNDE